MAPTGRTPDQFRQILLRTNPDGSLVRLGDVARVAMGAETESFIARYNGHPASGIAIKLSPGELLDDDGAVTQKHTGRCSGC